MTAELLARRPCRSAVKEGRMEDVIMKRTFFFFAALASLNLTLAPAQAFPRHPTGDSRHDAATVYDLYYRSSASEPWSYYASFDTDADARDGEAELQQTGYETFVQAVDAPQGIFDLYYR